MASLAIRRSMALAAAQNSFGLRSNCSYLNVVTSVNLLICLCIFTDIPIFKGGEIFIKSSKRNIILDNKILIIDK